MQRFLVGAFAAVLFVASAFGQNTMNVPPSPLLQVDRNRASVVDGIVANWQEVLLAKHGTSAGQAQAQLREALMGLRADRLLAASLAGSYATLDALISDGRSDAAAVAKVAAKNLGDASADLTYTPINPCRIVDTRNAGGPLAANVARTFAGYNASSFAAQGGTATNCGMPNGVAAIAMNVYAVNPTNLGFIKVWAANASEPAVSTVNYQVGITAIATGAIVPVDGTNNNGFSAKSPAGVDFIADVVGYFKAPGDATGLDILANGQRVMRYEYNATSPNVIGGSSANGVVAPAFGAVVAGGGASGALVTLPTIGTHNCRGDTGPCANQVTDAFGTVGGGVGNRVGDASGAVDSAPFATVSGGWGNTASGIAGAVGGGDANSASGNYATIAGGNGNVASGNVAAVGGGGGNSASNSFATVAGGATNTASGYAASVPGGADNTASGLWSFASGHSALADQSGCAVFGFFSSGPANCKGLGNVIRLMADHGFSVDWGAANGSGGGTWWVEINDITPCRPINTYTNAYLSCSGVWTSNSDRNKKEHFAAVDSRSILERLVALPVTQWNYKVEPGVRRMGPMAQDFHAAFDLGPDDLTIAQTDEAGVAFLAIQGLNAKVEEQRAAKDEQIAAQAIAIAELRGRLTELELQAAELAKVKQQLAELLHGRTTTAAAVTQ